VRSSLDSKDHIPIYQVVTATRDKKGKYLKEDKIGSFSCSYTRLGESAERAGWILQNACRSR